MLSCSSWELRASRAPPSAAAAAADPNTTCCSWRYDSPPGSTALSSMPRARAMPKGDKKMSASGLAWRRVEVRGSRVERQRASLESSCKQAHCRWETYCCLQLPKHRIAKAVDRSCDVAGGLRRLRRAHGGGGSHWRRRSQLAPARHLRHTSLFQWAALRQTQPAASPE